jgi:hypothetical protein
MLGRRAGAIMGTILVFFHLSISRVMSLTFEENMILLTVFFVNVPWWIYRGGKAAVTKARS